MDNITIQKIYFFFYIYLSYYKDNLLSRNIDVVNIGQKFILHALFSYLDQFYFILKKLN